MYGTLAFSGRSKNSAPCILGTVKTIKYASNTFSNNTRCLAAYKKVRLSFSGWKISNLSE